MKLKTQEKLNEWLEDQISNCVKCGACHASCPIFRIERHEGSGIRGKIALLQSRNKEPFPSLEEIEKRLAKCLSCSNCKAVCVNKVETLFLSEIVKLVFSPEKYQEMKVTFEEGISKKFPIFPADRTAIVFSGFAKSVQNGPFHNWEMNAVEICRKCGVNGFLLPSDSMLTPPSRFSKNLRDKISWISTFFTFIFTIKPSNFIFGNLDIFYFSKLAEILFEFSEEELKLLYRPEQISSFLFKFSHDVKQKIEGRFAFFESCLSLSGLYNSSSSKKLLSLTLCEKPLEIPQEGICCGAKSSFEESIKKISKINSEYLLEKFSRMGINSIVTDNQPCSEQLIQLFEKTGIKLYSSLELIAKAIL
ncbi:MAG: (Fe-S)-binding protein [Candidatus Riflebacteria bacterium]|nr:(Fe-S)-binding protein [Candidatus Riflebacteria bacterium]